MMDFELAMYGDEYAVFCTTSRCYVCFGSKSQMVKRVKALNQ